MKFLTKYTNINGFLDRFTIIQICKLHIRLHKIKDVDRTNLYHNHPFNYISIILKGGYTESYINKGEIKTQKYNRFSIINRRHDIYHRIDKINGETITLFITFGKYKWDAINLQKDTKNDGIYRRKVNNKEVWAKKQNGVWFIGHNDIIVAEAETRHSIHQI